MKSKNSIPIPKHKTVGHYDGFSITEEVFHAFGDGKMICLTTGEVTARRELKERGKGTWLKVSLESR